MKRIRNERIRASRAGLVILGVVLLAASVTGLLLATKAVHTIGTALDSRTAILNRHGSRLLHNHELAFQIAALVTGLALIALGLRWLATHLPHVRRQQDATVPNTAEAEVPGRNVVAGSALSDALQEQLEASTIVQRARAEVGEREEPIRLRIDIDETVPIPRVLDEVVEPALRRLRSVIEFDAERPMIDIRPVPGIASRVR